jgi:hypothetical protein
MLHACCVKLGEGGGGTHHRAPAAVMILKIGHITSTQRRGQSLGVPTPQKKTIGLV